MKTDVKPWEKHYQVGNIVKIVIEPENGRRLGFRLGTEHPIVEPPNKENLNCGGHIWVFDKFGKHFCLPFYCYKWLGKVIKPMETPQKIKRVRTK